MYCTAAHKDSVTHCAVSAGGLFASADMVGEVFVHSLCAPSTASPCATGATGATLSSTVHSESFRQDFAASTGSEVLWIDWHPTAPVLLAGCADGTVWLWHIRAGATKTFPGSFYCLFLFFSLFSYQNKI